MYFYILNRYKPTGVTAHLIEAKDKKDALRIAVDHDIRDSSRVDYIVSKRIIREATDLEISRRQRHMGGKIWYEDKKGVIRTKPKKSDVK